MNKTLKMILKLQQAGHKVRYTKSKWGRGFKYVITGIDKANWKYTDKALTKAKTMYKDIINKERTARLVEARQTRETLLKRFTKTEQQLYKEMRGLWKTAQGKRNIKSIHPGMGKLPSLKTLMKNPSRAEVIKNYITKLKGNITSNQLFDIADRLQQFGRDFGVKTYGLQATLRSSSKTLTAEDYYTIKSYIFDSNNTNYIPNQTNPSAALEEFMELLKSLLIKA